MDAQAQDRAHRIGQKETVRVIRLVSYSEKETVEQILLERATRKQLLAASVLQRRKLALSILDRVLRPDAQKENEHEEQLTDEAVIRIDESKPLRPQLMSISPK